MQSNPDSRGKSDWFAWIWYAISSSVSDIIYIQFSRFGHASKIFRYIKAIVADTASVTQEANEIKLFGVIEPEQLRKKVLTIRDRDAQFQQGGGIPLKVQSDNLNNPLLDNSGNQQVTETLTDIKAINVEMRDLLVQMNQNIANLKAES